MTAVLSLFVALGIMGAFDTIVYHEWIARLPHDPKAKGELRLHAARDAVYAFLFASLAWFEPHGAAVLFYAALFATEIVITLSDFVTEDRIRRLPAGERITHALMGIVYGFILALFAPVAIGWFGLPAGFAPASYGLPSWALTVLAVGVAASGIRDAIASVRNP